MQMVIDEDEMVLMCFIAKKIYCGYVSSEHKNPTHFSFYSSKWEIND